VITAPSDTIPTGWFQPDHAIWRKFRAIPKSFDRFPPIAGRPLVAIDAVLRGERAMRWRVIRGVVTTR
jgi:hypothetical protein